VSDLVSCNTTPELSEIWQSVQFKLREAEKTHGRHEFVHRNPLEDLDVFEDVFRHLLLLV
jgi:hypothetical protein